MKHLTFDIAEERAPEVTKWCRGAFGKSKQNDTRISKILWWRRKMNTYDCSPDFSRNIHVKHIVRFYFKREADYTLFLLRWA
jgi:hypothetical protein